MLCTFIWCDNEIKKETIFSGKENTVHQINRKVKGRNGPWIFRFSPTKHFLFSSLNEGGHAKRYANNREVECAAYNCRQFLFLARCRSYRRSLRKVCRANTRLLCWKLNIFFPIFLMVSVKSVASCITPFELYDRSNYS